jgi:hypothetical protein
LQFIKGPLQRRMELALQKRIRRYGTMIHFVILAKQLFRDDWHQYGSPRIRILLWDAISHNVFTSARSGEFIESTARAGSGRGLYFRDVALVVFINENGDTEFANEVEKDAKGMTFTPGKRPRHSLHEGSGLHPLFCNPMLFRIAILWAMKAFRDFENLDNLLDFRPPEGQDVVQIDWHPDILDKPVYQRENGHIWSSRTYCAQLRDLGFRAKYEVPPQNHDFRTEGLHSIGKSCTLALFTALIRLADLHPQIRSTHQLSAKSMLGTTATERTTSSMPLRILEPTARAPTSATRLARLLTTCSATSPCPITLSSGIRCQRRSSTSSRAATSTPPSPAS